jgi:outer membrane immunogenic protein
MKKLLVAAVAAAGFCGAPALAADMPVKAAPAPMWNWTGFYVGVNGGFDSHALFTTTGAFGQGFHTSGGLIGGTAGYNWQSGAWVFGVELDDDWMSNRRSVTCLGAPANTCVGKGDELGSLRARLGWANGPVLIYGTGGAGFGHSTINVVPPLAGTSGRFDYDRWGWTAGAGVEWMLAPRWSAKLEYLHYGFGNSDAPVGTLSAVTDVHFRSYFDVVKIGLNYKFGG